MCLYPRMLINKKYVANKKNGGNVPAVPDSRVMYVPIGCQVCIECKKKKARDWQVRLLEEIKHNSNGVFVTLTFSNESYIALSKCKEVEGLTGYYLDNGIAKLGVRRFLERWRKKYKKSVRHWLITEIGHSGTENVHLHGIIFTDKWKKIASIWQYGYVWDGNYRDKERENYVSERTVNYITKYITKVDDMHLTFMPRVLCSPGIGRGYDTYTNRYRGKQTIETYRTGTGHKISLPIYYRNKAFTEKEREQLWLNKLDQGYRYVCGERVTAADKDSYINMVEYHRRRQIELGYRPPEYVWSKEEYEAQRRRLMLDKRKEG